MRDEMKKVDLEEEEYIAAGERALSGLDEVPEQIVCIYDIASIQVSGDELAEVFRQGIKWERERLDYENRDSQLVEEEE